MFDVEQGDDRHWVCPRRTHLPAIWDHAVARWSATVTSLAHTYARAPWSFGLELRSAYIALLHASDLLPADNDFWTTKCRKLFARPAVEPIIISFCKRSSDLTLDREGALALAALLTGQPARYRHLRAVGQSRRGDVHFEPLNIAARWQAVMSDEIREARRDQPIYVFARTIMAHPFADGNGRFARVLFASTLARELALPVPCLAFAPSFYRYGERLHEAMASLSKTGDWCQLTEVMIALVDDAVMLTTRAAQAA